MRKTSPHTSAPKVRRVCNPPWAKAVGSGPRPFRRVENPFHIESGSSLLLVLWAIMLMSFAVIGLVTHLSRGLDESLRAEKEFRARLLLQSARTLASHPDIEWGDSLLHQRVSSSTSYEIILGTEGMRVAINQIA